MSHTFIRNCWYVAAWTHEVQNDALFERRILGESVLFYRLASTGEVVALNNKCCHRHAPLSMGRREGDCVRCMYHGLKFDSQGKCVEIPGQEFVPARVGVKPYPIVETKRWIWIWLGDPRKADRALLPDTFSLDHPDWRMKPGYLKYQANHLLISDNLLDFSHLSYVHESSLGGTSKIAETRARQERIPRGIRLIRHVLNTVPAPYHTRLTKISGNVDRWWIYDYVVPGILLLDSGAKPSEGSGDPGAEVKFHSCQALTPESEHSTHYFFAQAHAFALDDPAVTEATHESVLDAFEEDRRIIEAQQRLIDETPAVDMLGLPMDAALGRFRALYRSLLDEETREAGAPSAQLAGVEAKN